jgi:hypothetical protein
MSATSVKLLQAAAEIAGGTRALAWRLGISETLLSKFMADRRELPDVLLLRAVDIVLADPTAVRKVAGEVEDLQNGGRGNGAGSQAEPAG